jgi:short-subunit dehydrogenase
MEKMTYTGRTALVTGASTGIGRAFAVELAARGSDLVLVARSRDKLEALAAELHARHGVRAEAIALDLARPGAVADLTGQLAERGREVDILVNNAGFGMHGAVAAADPARVHEQVQLNVAAVVDLTTAVLPAMVTSGSGAILNVASTISFQPVPRMAVYGASKAFVLSFSEALWAEARAAGVRVTAIAPGQTETPFFAIAGEDAAFGRRRMPEQVVATALRALERNAPSAVDGLMNALLARVAPRITPRRAVISIAERLVRPRGSGRDRTVPSAA